MNKLTCLAMASLFAFSAAGCSGGNDAGVTELINEKGARVTVVKSLYNVNSEKKEKLKPIASYKDDNYWYYSFNLGTINGIPFEAADHYYHAKGIKQTYQFTIKQTTVNEATTTAKRIVNNAWKVSAAVEMYAKGSKGASFDTGMGLGLSRSVESGINFSLAAEVSGSTAFESTYSETTTSSTSTEKTSIIEFTDAAAEGYWYYLHTANIKVYGTIVYNPAKHESYYRFDSKVVSSGYTLYYAGLDGRMPDEPNPNLSFDVDLDFNNMVEPERYVGLKMVNYRADYQGENGEWLETRRLDPRGTDIYYDWDFSGDDEKSLAIVKALNVYSSSGYNDVEISWSCQAKSDDPGLWGVLGHKPELFFEVGRTKSNYLPNSRMPRENFYNPDTSGASYSGSVVTTITDLMQTKFIRIHAGNKSNDITGFVWNMSAAISIKTS